MPIAPRIIHSDGVLRLATWQNVAIADVAGDIDLPRMMRLGRLYRDLVAEFPKGIVSCSMVAESTPVASQQSRNEAARFIKELGDSCLRMALVIEHRGVMAQVLRSVVRGLNVVTRNTKLVLFDDVREAVDALTPLVAPLPSGGNVNAELRAAVASVRAGRGSAHAQHSAHR